MTQSSDTNIKDLAFEKAMSELENIVARLEKGEVSLEESINLYDRGEKLRTHCDHLLKKAEERIEKIVQGPDGKAVSTKPLDEDLPF